MAGTAAGTRRKRILAPKSIQLGTILTERQRIYIIMRHHEGMYVSAIAEACGVVRDTVYKTLKRAYARLEAAGIKPPPTRRDAGTVQKGDRLRVCVTVDPQTLAQSAVG